MNLPDALPWCAAVLGFAWYVVEQVRSETQLEIERRGREERESERKRNATTLARAEKETE